MYVDTCSYMHKFFDTFSVSSDPDNPTAIPLLTIKVNDGRGMQLRNKRFYVVLLYVCKLLANQFKFIYVYTITFFCHEQSRAHLLSLT